MYTLHNGTLEVHVLDPVADQSRMGARYCSGGYIFQIADAQGPLLSGPTYPDDFNWFDGQGIPDSFAQAPLRDPERPDATALIIGIGVCDTVARSVIEHCSWDVEVHPDRIRFATRHEWRGVALTVEREVRLAGRLVQSETWIGNPGTLQLPMRWFPHPFYPIPDEPALCALPAPVTVPAGSGYTLDADGYLRCEDLSARRSAPVRCNDQGPLCVLQRHPRLGMVGARYSFAARHVLVWGNENTFSFEPYLEDTVGPGITLHWCAEYTF